MNINNIYRRSIVDNRSAAAALKSSALLLRRQGLALLAAKGGTDKKANSLLQKANAHEIKGYWYKYVADTQ